MIANDILVPLEGQHGEATHTVNSPMRLIDVPKVSPRLAPELGQHSVDVLQELDFSAAEIAELKSSGAVVAAS